MASVVTTGEPLAAAVVGTTGDSVVASVVGVTEVSASTSGGYPEFERKWK